MHLYEDGAGWKNWRYTPYQNLYDTTSDATATLIDFSAFGVVTNAVVTAIEICNLQITGWVDELIAGELGQGTL